MTHLEVAARNGTPRRPGRLLLVLPLFFIGCSGSDEVPAGSETGALAEPELHRPVAAACERERAPGELGGEVSPDSECLADDDCTTGRNGRCDWGGWNGNDRIGTCSYDLCSSDDDCEAAQVCHCEGGGGWYSPVPSAECMPGNCRLDSDCGESGFCSPSPNGQAGGGVAEGYYCHTPADECHSDSDCSAEADGHCRYMYEPLIVGKGVDLWVCQYGGWVH